MQANNKSLPERVASLEQQAQQTLNAIETIRDNTTKMTNTLTQLAVLEERHLETRQALGRAFKEIKSTRMLIDAHQAQLGQHAIELAKLEPVRRWMMASVTTLAGGWLVFLAWQVMK